MGPVAVPEHQDDLLAPQPVRRGTQTCCHRLAHQAAGVSIGGAGLAASALQLGLLDELRTFRYPIIVGGGTPFLPPVTEDVPLDLVETRTLGSRVIYERYRRGRPDSN